MKLCLSLILCLSAGPLLTAQPVAFDVASVKPAADPGMVPMICLVPCSPGERLSVEGARVDIRYMSLYRLILTAYPQNISTLRAGLDEDPALRHFGEDPRWRLQGQ